MAKLSDVSLRVGTAEAVAAYLGNAPVWNATSLVLDFINAGTLDPRITFTRASAGTYWGSDGLLKTVTVNTPRFDYDPSTLQPKGLLIEDQRTNLLVHSNDFTQWNLTGGMTAARNQLGLDGAANTGTLVTTAVGENCSARSIVTVVLTNSAVHTFSAIAKADTATKIVLGVEDNQTWKGFIFDLVTDEIVNWDLATHKTTIVDLGGGRKQCSVTWTTGATGSQSAGVIYVDNYGPASGNKSLTLYHAQVEAGAAASSPIITGASQVTRAADLALLPVGSWYNQTEGAWIADYVGGYASSQPGYGRVLGLGRTLDDGANYCVLSSNGSNSNAGTWIGVDAIEAYGPHDYWNTGGKAGVTYSPAGRSVCAGGAVVSSTYTFPATQVIGVGSGIKGENTLAGHLRSLTYYPRRLSDARLQALTSV